jgi:3-oxoacyl-[acyl-carrier protein] reductase
LEKKLIIKRYTAVLPGSLCYLATKGAIEQIARVLAKELGPRGINVNTVSPGQLDTPLFRENKTPGIIDSIKQNSSTRRLGGPEDIAPIVAFLASEGAQWINGQNIQVDGVSKNRGLGKSGY